MNPVLVTYLRLLRIRWRWLVWGVLLALAVATVVLILQPPMYQSKATVLVRTPGDVSRVVDGGDTYARSRAATYAQLAKSSTVAERVIADLHLDIAPATLSSRINAENVPGTALITVTASAPSAGQAQQTATMFLSGYGATVRMLESVPGSLVPRAELVVVDPPGMPSRMVASGVPLPLLLFGVALTGLVAAATIVAVRSALHPYAETETEPSGVKG
ncbi:YveK family protein [Mycolicibacterium smegmatis]|uniref:Capsular polysaccharide biosynthesis protein n=1 Tax=Mycolicibacterium smegmatis (strain ATCC 700084 / mc(2)155) TaxID=246196 RepID=I7G9E2_MYCS2|nr:Wzz/FepE/Etk N-terminal domain-containing protein [Mycolicibacterium smegmatis]AFP42227.1 Capsular polysaccharide biosynthesis protein [Mycolicibacterium smegmatis MC2 155]AIU10955.1 cell shape-determining protein [Mycolicibacterium smegmatis MC2 155]AIU17579.1 cell shape-determining protein [Mycolicibacterium smegmatis]AIU24203.1 cell shape-determining protein [Mycolicibacterium smegmatis]MBE9619407.1 cell shape-determining protein [Mycolicibacterium smegmatis]